MRRWGVIAGVLVVVLGWASTQFWSAPTPETSANAAAPVLEPTPREPPAAVPIEAPRAQAHALPEAPSRPGDRALARLDEKASELPGLLDALVADGDINEEEAEQLYRIGLGTLDDGRDLVHRIQTGEITWVGGLVRRIPLKITHASRVIDVLGYDRAKAIGDKRRAEKAALNPSVDEAG